MDFLTPELTAQLFDISLLILSALVTGLIVPMIYKLGALATMWVESKTHSAAFACATEKLTALVAEAVLDTEQSLVKKLKEAGQWDATAMGSARDSAYDSVVRNLGPAGLKEVMGCLKLDESGLAGRISGMIEAYLAGNNEHA